ncbi:hypothetical protein H5410_000795 [Solanum commersonii]|uniref:Uncharacterized protein n=1 Tax=Solanum commersonii TaxID=4109 RepID=A0A9J6AX27_SOLCO|nr:hypothetical protein H5410_000795 [Solanum commersonii]
MHHEKVIEKYSKNDAMIKSVDQVRESSSVLPSPIRIRLWGCDLINPSNEEKGKVKLYLCDL